MAARAGPADRPGRVDSSGGAGPGEWPAGFSFPSGLCRDGKQLWALAASAEPVGMWCWVEVIVMGAPVQDLRRFATRRLTNQRAQLRAGSCLKRRAWGLGGGGRGLGGGVLWRSRLRSQRRGSVSPIGTIHMRCHRFTKISLQVAFSLNIVTTPLIYSFFFFLYIVVKDT